MCIWLVTVLIYYRQAPVPEVYLEAEWTPRLAATALSTDCLALLTSSGVFLTSESPWTTTIC